MCDKLPFRYSHLPTLAETNVGFLFPATFSGVHAIAHLIAQVLCLCDTLDLVFASSVDALVKSFDSSLNFLSSPPPRRGVAKMKKRGLWRI